MREMRVAIRRSRPPAGGSGGIAACAVASRAWAQLLRRQEEVLEEEGRELGPAGESRLAIHRERLLANGAVARAPQAGHLLQGEALEEEKRHLSLSRGELPALELAVDGGPEASQHVLGL